MEYEVYRNIIVENNDNKVELLIIRVIPPINTSTIAENTEAINKLVTYYLEKENLSNSYVQYKVLQNDNPWERVIIFGINNLRFTKYTFEEFL